MTVVAAHAATHSDRRLASMNPRPIEPPASSPWRWSNVVSLIASRHEAAATVRFFTCLRETIAEPTSWWRTAAEYLPDVTPEEWRRIKARECSVETRSALLLRSLKPIALDPTKRADALLALDVHIAYLRAQFGLTEET
jgi:hypothetical protein